MNEYSDIMVCVDCMVAHHYGWDSVEEVDPADPPEWWIGEGEQRTDREPWNEIPADKFDVTDNTDSNAGYKSPGCIDTCKCGATIVYQWNPLWGWEWAHIDTGLYGCAPDDYFEVAEPTYDTGIDEFSMSSCDGCGSHLGGARYRFALWERGKA